MALRTDTAAQAQLGQHIGDVATATTASIHGIEGETTSVASRFVGAAGSALQAKIQQMQETGLALTNQINNIGEKVGVAAGGYSNTDETGAGLIQASGQAF